MLQAATRLVVSFTVCAVFELGSSKCREEHVEFGCHEAKLDGGAQLHGGVPALSPVQ
jgi:hypothetical protein